MYSSNISDLGAFLHAFMLKWRLSVTILFLTPLEIAVTWVGHTARGIQDRRCASFV